MIGYISGKIIFSDGREIIIMTSSGIGYQLFYNLVLPEGRDVDLYVGHIIKEAGEELYAFSNLREKKLFELLIKVKGIGPKTAFSLMSALGINIIIDAITFENNKALGKAPGIGSKAASQIILDLAGKIHKVKMYSEKCPIVVSEIVEAGFDDEKRFEEYVYERNNFVDESSIMVDAIMACKELGFNEESVMTLAKDIMKSKKITKPEQLVHLVLKGM